MIFGKQDAKKKAIDELLGHLDGKDDESLSSAVKPKGLEVTKVEAIGDDDAEKPEVDEAPVMGDVEGADLHEGGDKPKLSDEDLQELIEAIQAKLC